ncbi:sugar O-acetyltransferase [Entomohabitans teleogrylli]|uniref:sugar O-acetyltransferase n=1 Tax=Entomohabitans teleogrylli TaxID=1384589 RepID=UPI00073DAAE0|nr:sugar O-acetyltransferase [Entomohabitans teleogrylli]
MTEAEKALLGLLYDANGDPALIAARNKAKYLLHLYNHTDPRDSESRDSQLRVILGKAGSGLLIEQPFYCDYGNNIEVGDNFYANHNLVILDGNRVTIGNNVFIAPNVGIHTAGHPLDPHQRNQGLEYAKPITIGDNVWIGAGVNILPGVTIGSNTVIGAGSVVTKSLPAWVVAAGNPCRVLRAIDDSEKS